MNLENLRENIILADHTTFRIGGPARYFFEAKTKEDIIEAIKWAGENNLPYFILGGGSNLLVNDEGFKGLVIRNKFSKINIEEAGEVLKIKASAGVLLGIIVAETVKRGFSGVEWAFGIPGTIGGAIWGNAHRAGRNMKPVVENVFVLNSELEEKKIGRDELEFDYGRSRFQKTGEIIISVDLVFKKETKEIIGDVLSQAKEISRGHAPYPSAGCVFRNYKLRDENDDILRRHPELESRVREGKIGVGYLIDQCGLKGKQIGGAKVWEGHANYIVNVGGAKASDISELIEFCKKTVKEKYGVELEEEIRYLGF